MVRVVPTQVEACPKTDTKGARHPRNAQGHCRCCREATHSEPERTRRWRSEERKPLTKGAKWSAKLARKRRCGLSRACAGQMRLGACRTASVEEDENPHPS